MVEWIALGGLVAWALRAQRSAQQLDAESQDGMITMFAPGVVAFAKAVARQEGFGVRGALPTDCHNPCDLADPTGRLFPQYATRGPEMIVVFPDDATGWDAAYRQFQYIADGRSKIYSRAMTIAEMATHYAPKPDPTIWAANVAAFLGVTPDTALDAVL